MAFRFHQPERFSDGGEKIRRIRCWHRLVNELRDLRWIGPRLDDRTIEGIRVCVREWLTTHRVPFTHNNGVFEVGRYVLDVNKTPDNRLKTTAYQTGATYVLVPDLIKLFQWWDRNLEDIQP